MELSRRSLWVYALLGAVWVLVLGWQVEEHLRVKEAARIDLRNRSKDIANTLSALIRGMRFRGGAVSQERLELVLNELVHGRTNELVQSSALISIVLLNATNQQVASAGRPSTSSGKTCSRRANIGVQERHAGQPGGFGREAKHRRGHQHLHGAVWRPHQPCRRA